MGVALSLDQRRELRGLDLFEREWFQLVAAATATALSEGRTSTISTSAPEILDCYRRLALHFSASVEIVERDGLIDVHLSPAPSCRKASPRGRKHRPSAVRA
jgi:hypothetical protein